MKTIESRLKEIEARADAARYQEIRKRLLAFRDPYENEVKAENDFFDNCVRDIEFLLGEHARTDVPRLVKALRKLISQRDGHIHHWGDKCNVAVEFRREIILKSNIELAAILDGEIAAVERGEKNEGGQP